MIRCSKPGPTTSCWPSSAAMSLSMASWAELRYGFGGLHQPVEIVSGQSQSQSVQWGHGKRSHKKNKNAATGLWFSDCISPFRRVHRPDSSRGRLVQYFALRPLPPTLTVGRRCRRVRARRRVPARLQNGAGGNRLEAAGIALPVRAVAGLAQVQESGGSGGETGSGRGLGELILERSLVASFFANRLLGELSRLHSSASRASLVHVRAMSSRISRTRGLEARSANH